MKNSEKKSINYLLEKGMIEKIEMDGLSKVKGGDIQCRPECNPNPACSSQDNTCTVLPLTCSHNDPD